jgi:peptide/nickel transport system ATP-binding protein
MTAPLLEVAGLATHFFTRGGIARAVDGVDLVLQRGRILGLVGESGSGKTVTGFSILGLVDPPGRIVAGSIRFDGRELVGLPAEELRRLRGRRIAMVFQDPMMTLNPVLTIGDQMLLALRAHERVGRAAGLARAGELLAKVGIPSAAERLKAYPHQLSGGMRQRVAIATAMLHRPDLIVADEPTTALDVSIQGQILHEMRRLARETGVALIWISHDLAVVSNLADDIAVMYAGRIVENGPAREVLERPRHPYTQGLLDSVPGDAPPGSRLAQIPGATPSLLRLPQGCSFRERCARADPTCAQMPELRAGSGAPTAVRCHHPLPVAP